MNLLICTGIYPPDIGGPATYSKLISEKLSQRGHSVRILTYAPLSSRAELRQSAERSRGISFVSKKFPAGIRHLAYFWQVLKLGRSADIIYVQDSVSVGFPAALANLFLKKKFILKVVGDYAWEQSRQITNYELPTASLDDFYPFSKSHSFKIDLLYLIQNWVARKADKIITPSFYLKKILIDGWKIGENKIKVIYNSFDINQSIINHQSSIINSFKILSVGRLVPWKGFDTLIDIVKDMPNVELEIIGDGPMKEKLESGIRNQELGNKIKLMGRLGHEDVIKKMQEADLFVLNTAYEGLSHVILEAMACGLPVAVSRAGGNTELVGENEERGELFEYNNKERIKEKIIHMENHRDIHMDKAKKAKEFVFGFNQEKMINELENNLQR
ncbi:glycosyltransferase family 4 protein [Patescibacteria group bacterium]|nr:glycosyltransferase family 4 protein [Patescibacteria group bacterium]